MMLMRILVGTLVFCLCVLPCSARVVKEWSHEEMQKAADLVVIAKPVKSQSTGEKLDSWIGTEGVDTTFEVMSALKGTLDGKLVVHHYAFSSDVRPPNAPSFVSFPTGEKAANYLLFLKKGTGGSYEPVVGQVDPTDCCFRLVKAYE